MKIACLCTVMMLCALSVSAQEGRIVDRFTIEGRGDYVRDYVDGNTRQDMSGFKGKFFNLLLDGTITDRLTYSIRHRFNRLPEGENFFKATDWFFIDYRPNDHWTLSGGKQVIDIGGWEYDYAPINHYFCSEFWNQTACYAWGISAAWHPSETDMLRFQICESPVRQLAAYRDKDLYTYNLMWYGYHGLWSSKWSANLVEWENGHYISYLALGNEFRFCPEVSLELDYMNRATSSHTFFFRDCSVMGQLNYQPSPYLKFFAKATYDVNRTDSPADYTVMPGTELTRVGVGTEYYPLGDKRLRLHANYCYSMGTNTNPDAVMHDKHSVVDMGLTWRLNIVK